MLGLVTNVGMGSAKFVVGIHANSSALIADAVHSASDAVTDLIAWGAIHLSSRPADKTQPYGFGHYDTLGSLALGLSLLAAGGGTASMAFSSFQRALSASDVNFESIPPHLVYLGLATSVLSVGTKELLFRVTKSLAEESKSPLILANAYHHRSDALSSVVAGLCVGGTALHLPLLDPIGGIFVAGLILKSGFDTVVRAVANLTDRQTIESIAIVEAIKSVATGLISNPESEIRNIHDVRLRQMGAANVADLHVVVVR